MQGMRGSLEHTICEHGRPGIGSACRAAEACGGTRNQPLSPSRLTVPYISESIPIPSKFTQRSDRVTSSSQATAISEGSESISTIYPEQIMSQTYRIMTFKHELGKTSKA
eukprot:751524-Hanusia_phi.AAC.1